MVERPIDKAQIPASLVGNRQDGGPLRRTCAGTAETIEAGRDAGDVEVRQDAMQHSGVVRHVRHSPLLAAVNRALLIRRLVVQHTESATGGDGRAEVRLEVAEWKSFVPRDLAEMGSGSRICGRITAKGGETVPCRLELRAADCGDERVAGG